MTVKLDIRNTVKDLTQLVNRAVEQEAELHRSRIVINATRGQDYEGSRLRDYSERYKRQRELEGRRVAPPDLTRTGHLLQSLKTKRQDVGNGVSVKIFFTGGTNIRSGASANEKAQNLIKLGFKFFGISREQIQEVIRNVKRKTGIR